MDGTSTVNMMMSVGILEQMGRVRRVGSVGKKHIRSTLFRIEVLLILNQLSKNLEDKAHDVFLDLLSSSGPDRQMRVM